MQEAEDSDKAWRKNAKGIGAWVKHYRTSRDTSHQSQENSQQLFADFAGISRQQWQNIESGTNRGKNDESGVESPSNPTIRTLTSMARVLGVTVADLLPEGLGGKAPPPPPANDEASPDESTG